MPVLQTGRNKRRRPHEAMLRPCATAENLARPVESEGSVWSFTFWSSDVLAG